MKRIIWVVLIIIFLAPIAQAKDQGIEATTKDGRKVELFPDGTWQFAQEEPLEASPTSTKPNNATEVLKSKKQYVEFWFDPKKWVVAKEKGNEAAEFELDHISGDAYALMIVERIPMPLETLKKTALSNLREVDPNAKALFEERRTVNGQEGIVMTTEFEAEGIPFVYHGFYWAGEEGALQFVTYTSRNLLEEFQDDFDELINGVVIQKE